MRFGMKHLNHYVVMIILLVAACHRAPEQSSPPSSQLSAAGVLSNGCSFGSIFHAGQSWYIDRMLGQGANGKVYALVDDAGLESQPR